MKEKVSGNVFTAWAKPVPWHITWDQPWNINDILGVNGLKLEFFLQEYRPQSSCSHHGGYVYMYEYGGYVYTYECRELVDFECLIQKVNIGPYSLRLVID